MVLSSGALLCVTRVPDFKPFSFFDRAVRPSPPRFNRGSPDALELPYVFRQHFPRVSSSLSMTFCQKIMAPFSPSSFKCHGRAPYPCGFDLTTPLCFSPDRYVVFPPFSPMISLRPGALPLSSLMYIKRARFFAPSSLLTVFSFRSFGCSGFLFSLPSSSLTQSPIFFYRSEISVRPDRRAFR